jgi:hypothetical protein
MAVVVNTLAEDALAANRAGRLASSQQTAWVGIERAWIGGYRLGALAFAAVGVAVLLGLGAAEPATTRLLGIAGCFVVAAVLSWASFVPARRLAQDLREGRIEIVEGPIRKRRVTGGGSMTRTRCYLVAGGRQFECSSGQYDRAPETGAVRLFVLPRSRKVVNLEPLVADGPLARAAEDHPSAASIVGAWRGQGMTATFAPDGTAEAQLPNGIVVTGRWSIDAHGRVRVTGLGGEDAPVEVAIAGDAMDVRMDGVRLPFRRA